MKRIIITVANLNVGGIQRVLLSLLNTLDLNKYIIDLFILEKGGELESLVPQKINIEYMQSCRKSSHIFSKIYKAILFHFKRASYYKNSFNKEKYKNKQYDIAIAFDGYNNYSDYYAAFSNAKKKYIWVHSDYYNRAKMDFKFRVKFHTMKAKYKYFDKIIAVSKSAEDSFIKLLPQHKDKIQYLWNIVDGENIIKKSKEKSKIKLDGDLKIVSIGRLVYQKGFEKLVELHKSLIDKGIGVKTYLIGDGKEKEFIEKKIKKYNIKDSFIMLGSLENPFPILKQANIYVSTSIIEGLPTTLLESLVLSIPIVAIDIPGVKDVCEQIAPKGMASLCSNSISELTEEVIKLYNEKDRKRSNYDFKKYNDEIIKVFGNLIGKE